MSFRSKELVYKWGNAKRLSGRQKTPGLGVTRPKTPKVRIPPKVPQDRHGPHLVQKQRNTPPPRGPLALYYTLRYWRPSTFFNPSHLHRTSLQLNPTTYAFTKVAKAALARARTRIKPHRNSARVRTSLHGARAMRSKEPGNTAARSREQN